MISFSPLRILVAVCAVLLSSTVSAAPLIDQTGNLLANGSMESGSFTAVTGHGVVSAADNWRQWSNSGTTLTSELITEAEMFLMTGNTLIDGNAALMITTNGAGDGGFTFDTFSHPGWDTQGDVTFSGWVYVITGQMGFMVGANSPGHFDVAATTGTGQWEFVSISKAGGPTAADTNNEPLLYSIGGPATFIVDSVWLNQGLTSAHPGASVPTPASNGLMILGLLGLTLLGIGSRRVRLREAG